MNPERLSEAYKEWMLLLGYNEDTAQTAARQVHRFLSWLQEQGVQNLSHVSETYIQKWYEQKKSQSKTMLRNSTLNGYQINLHRFSKYLLLTEQGNLEMSLMREEVQEYERVILTEGEIQQLYQTAENGTNPIENKIMLHLYYGCGLRASEGVNLNTEDILLEKNLVYVKKGKGYKDRYVPIVAAQAQDFVHYLSEKQQDKKKYSREKALFINGEGKRVGKGYPNEHFKKLVQQTQNESLIAKKPSLHSLRHSIATHLLKNGMDIELIAKLLGHARIATTQTYTHIAHIMEAGYADTESNHK